MSSSAKPAGVGAACQPWILAGKQSGLLTDTAKTVSVLLCVRMKRLTAFVELEAAIRTAQRDPIWNREALVEFRRPEGSDEDQMPRLLVLTNFWISLSRLPCGFQRPCRPGQPFCHSSPGVNHAPDGRR